MTSTSTPSSGCSWRATHWCAWSVPGVFPATSLLRARIENLFDADYESVSGYNTAPRTAIVGINLRY